MSDYAVIKVAEENYESFLKATVYYLTEPSNSFYDATEASLYKTSSPYLEGIGILYYLLSETDEIIATYKKEPLVSVCEEDIKKWWEKNK